MHGSSFLRLLVVHDFNISLNTEGYFQILFCKSVIGFYSTVIGCFKLENSQFIGHYLELLFHSFVINSRMNALLSPYLWDGCQESCFFFTIFVLFMYLRCVHKGSLSLFEVWFFLSTTSHNCISWKYLRSIYYSLVFFK